MTTRREGGEEEIEGGRDKGGIEEGRRQGERQGEGQERRVE